MLKESISQEYILAVAGRRISAVVAADRRGAARGIGRLVVADPGESWRLRMWWRFYQGEGNSSETGEEGRAGLSFACEIRARHVAPPSPVAVRMRTRQGQPGDEILNRLYFFIMRQLTIQIRKQNFAHALFYELDFRPGIWICS
jgi:hypothetical protein